MAFDFAKVQEENKKKQEKLAAERKDTNKQTKRSYRITENEKPEDKKKGR